MNILDTKINVFHAGLILIQTVTFVWVIAKAYFGLKNHIDKVDSRFMDHMELLHPIRGGANGKKKK